MPGFMDAFVEQLSAAGIARPEDLRGCRPQEVEFLEYRCGVRFPAAYRAFLLRAGYAAGALVDPAELDIYYPRLLLLNLEERGLPTEPEGQAAGEEDGGAGSWLPRDAFIVLGRYGEQFYFITARGGEESPVHYYHADSGEIKQEFESCGTFFNMLLRNAVKVRTVAQRFNEL